MFSLTCKQFYNTINARCLLYVCVSVLYMSIQLLKIDFKYKIYVLRFSFTTVVKIYYRDIFVNYKFNSNYRFLIHFKRKKIEIYTNSRKVNNLST